MKYVILLKHNVLPNSGCMGLNHHTINILVLPLQHSHWKHMISYISETIIKVYVCLISLSSGTIIKRGQYITFLKYRMQQYISADLWSGSVLPGWPCEEVTILLGF